MLADTFRNSVQLKLTISEDLSNLLVKWAQESGCARATILSKALTLYAVAIEAETVGNHMAIVSKANEVLQRIDGVR